MPNSTNKNSSNPIFYLDEFLHGDHFYNQVRLVGVERKDAKKSPGSKSKTGGQYPVIARGFTTDQEISIGIKHDFQKLDGLEGIGNLRNIWQTIRRKGITAAAVTQGVFAGLDNWVKNNMGTDSTLGDFTSGMSNITTDLSGVVQTYLQPDIDTADNWMTIFNGTNINVPVAFEEVLITDNINSSNSASGSLHEGSALGKLKKKLAYLIGEYKVLDKDGNSFIGATTPPNGFKTTLDGLKGGTPEGTFTLWYGNVRFPGVVVENIDIKMSKARVALTNGQFSPLYITINYVCRPVIKYTKSLLDNWMDAVSQNWDVAEHNTDQVS